MGSLLVEQFKLFGLASKLYIYVRMKSLEVVLMLSNRYFDRGGVDLNSVIIRHKGKQALVKQPPETTSGWQGGNVSNCSIRELVKLARRWAGGIRHEVHLGA